MIYSINKTIKKTKKQSTMKKIAFMLLASATILTSCGGGSEKTETTTDSTAVCCDSTATICDSTAVDTTVAK